MSDPRRLLDDESELLPEERRALEAGLAAHPPTFAKRNVRRALSAALGAGVLASGTAASGALVGVSFAKGLILGLVVGGGVSVGAMAMREPEPPAPAVVVPPAPVSAAPAITSDPPAAVVAPRVDEPAAPRMPSRPSGERALELPPTPASQPSTGALPDVIEARPAAPSNATLALAESRRVAEARALLRRGDARGALALLQRTANEFPNGVLVQEREALAIEALVAAGDRAGARGRAALFLNRYPESPHAAAARSVLAE